MTAWPEARVGVAIDSSDTGGLTWGDKCSKP